MAKVDSREVTKLVLKGQLAAEEGRANVQTTTTMSLQLQKW